MVEGRERPSITLEPVTETPLEELGGTDPTLEYVIDDDDYYYFDEYNMVDEDDRLAAINYEVEMITVVPILRECSTHPPRWAKRWVILRP